MCSTWLSAVSRPEVERAHAGRAGKCMMGGRYFLNYDSKENRKMLHGRLDRGLPSLNGRCSQRWAVTCRKWHLEEDVKIIFLPGKKSSDKAKFWGFFCTSYRLPKDCCLFSSTLVYQFFQTWSDVYLWCLCESFIRKQQIILFGVSDCTNCSSIICFKTTALM